MKYNEERKIKIKGVWSTSLLIAGVVLILIVALVT
jgi:hypothetical protein